MLPNLVSADTLGPDPAIDNNCSVHDMPAEHQPWILLTQIKAVKTIQVQVLLD